MRRRRHERGAAMVEMVLLAPVMITMWIGIDYFRSGYARRLDALAQAHAKAWTLAYSNDGSCFANQEPWAGFTGSTDPTDASNVQQDGANAVNQFKGSSSSSLFKYAHANVEATMQTRKAHWDGDAVGSMKGGMFIACDEVVPVNDSSNPFADRDVLTPVVDWVKSIL